MSRAPSLCNEINPLKNLAEKVSEHFTFRELDSNKVSVNPQVFLNQASTPLAETVEVFKKAKGYLDQGLSPSRIGVLLTCEKTYSSLVRAVFSEQEFLVTLPVV